MQKRAVPIRRMKSYSSEAGYVYQYYFVRSRQTRRPDLPGEGTEYIFAVSADRKTTFDLAVFVRHDCLEAWARQHGRGLTAPEQYAVAKMRLFRAFDESEEVPAPRRNIVVDEDNLEEMLFSLGID